MLQQSRWVILLKPPKAEWTNLIKKEQTGKKCKRQNGVKNAACKKHKTVTVYKDRRALQWLSKGHKQI